MRGSTENSVRFIGGRAGGIPMVQQPSRKPAHRHDIGRVRISFSLYKNVRAPLDPSLGGGKTDSAGYAFDLRAKLRPARSWLGENQFYGTIPESLGSLTALQDLCVSCASYAGPLV